MKPKVDQHRFIFSPFYSYAEVADTEPITKDYYSPETSVDQYWSKVCGVIFEVDK